MKVFNYPIEKFDKDLAFEINRKNNFRVVYSGSVRFIELSYLGYKYAGKLEKIEGMHISQKLFKDLRTYVDLKGTPKIPLNYNDIAINYYNKKNIISNINKDIVGIDINHCYWRNFYLNGFISQKTYNLGLIKPQYKQALHILLGSLNKNIFTEIYEKGVCIKKEFKKAQYSEFWYRCIADIDNMMSQFDRENPTSLLWFHTDCFYVPEKELEFTMQFLKEKGYNSKVKKYRIESMEDNILIYFDYEKNNYFSVFIGLK